MDNGRHLRQSEFGSNATGPGSLDFIQLTILPDYTVSGSNVIWDFALKASGNACLTMTNSIPANGYILELKDMPVGAYAMLVVKRPSGVGSPLYIRNSSSGYGTLKSNKGETYSVVLNPVLDSAETVTIVEIASVVETAASNEPVLWITSSYLQPWNRQYDQAGLVPAAGAENLVLGSGTIDQPSGGWTKIKKEMLDLNSVSEEFLTKEDLMNEDKTKIKDIFIPIDLIRDYLLNVSTGNPIFIENLPVKGVETGTPISRELNLKGLELRRIYNRNQSRSNRSATSLRSISRSEVPVLINQYFS